MKTIFNLFVMAVLLLVVSSPCFALWGHENVSKARAKELGMEFRSEPTGPNEVGVDLEFKTEGELKNFSQVDLRIGEGDNPPVTAPLREDRSKPGRVAVRFYADRGQLDKLSLWIRVPGGAGGTIYHLRAGDFVEPKKDR